jgi:hypothetical protein
MDIYASRLYMEVSKSSGCVEVISPVKNKSESPGRKKPMMIPFSAKSIINTKANPPMCSICSGLVIL